MKTLEHAMGTLRVSGAVQHMATLRGAWAFEVCPDADYASLYAVNAGRAWIKTSQGSPLHLHSGCVALVRPGMPHVVARKLCLPAVEARSFFSNCAFTTPLHLRNGEGGPRTELITGFYHAENSERNLLLSTLPSVMVLRESSDPSEGTSGSWTETLRELDRELRQQAPGYRAITNHLSEILLLRVIRAWLRTGTAADGIGFLARVTDPPIARALDALHGDLSGNWTVSSLAKCARLSRTAFATLFSARMGEGPASYTRRVRIQKACELLDNTQLSTAQVGSSVGYSSEAAFSRLFRERVGVTPAQWRRRRSLENAVRA